MVASVFGIKVHVGDEVIGEPQLSGEAGNALLVAPHGAKGAPLSATKSVSSVKGVVEQEYFN
jgi:hypothetical protein